METRKIAVVADIHANLYALQAFIVYLSTTDIEQVWNLGDFLQIGPYPAEVADLILYDPRFLTVVGNNERALLHRDFTAFPANQIAHQNWTITQLGQQRLARIRRFPSSQRLTVGNKQVLLTHEQPNIGEGTSDIDLICFGHTHLPSYEMHGTVGVMNPGSLGFGWGQSSNAFAVIEFSESAINVHNHAVSYDKSLLKQDYMQRQVPDREYIFSMFLPGE